MFNPLSIKYLFLHQLIIIGVFLICLNNQAAAQTSVQLSLPTNASGATGNVVSIPITINNTNPPKSVSSYTIDVSFNQNVLEPIQPVSGDSDPAIDKTDTLSSNCGIIIQYTGTAGRFNVSAIGCSINQSGILVKMLFRVIGAAGNTNTGSTNLAITRVLLEDELGNEISTTSLPGMFIVSTQSAGLVDISGRIMTPNGRGIFNTQVQLTTATGSKTVLSGPFGYFRFSGIEAGQTATIVVISKRFGFQPQTFTVSSDISNLNLVAR